MSWKAPILLGLLALGSTAALLADVERAPEATTRWEYAVYRSLGNRHQWQTPDAEIFANNLPDFCKQLGVKAPASRATIEIELANHFGAQGWELVQTDTNGTSAFWFKRAAR